MIFVRYFCDRAKICSWRTESKIAFEANDVSNNACPKCGCEERERGEFYPAGVLWDVRFPTENSLRANFKKVTTAIACQSCGYVELYLADHQGLPEEECVS